MLNLQTLISMTEFLLVVVPALLIRVFFTIVEKEKYRLNKYSLKDIIFFLDGIANSVYEKVKFFHELAIFATALLYGFFTCYIISINLIFLLAVVLAILIYLGFALYFLKKLVISYYEKNGIMFFVYLILIILLLIAIYNSIHFLYHNGGLFLKPCILYLTPKQKEESRKLKNERNKLYRSKRSDERKKADNEKQKRKRENLSDEVKKDRKEKQRMRVEKHKVSKSEPDGDELYDGLNKYASYKIPRGPSPSDLEKK